MQIDPTVSEILDSALSGQAPSKIECEKLLTFAPHSMEASALRAIADQISRRRFGGHGYIAGQIGIEVAPCPANCGFCAFGADFTSFQAHQLTDADILQRARDFVLGGDLHTLYLMTMHRFAFDRLLNVIESVRSICPPATEIIVNIGDMDAVQARELTSAGADGAYHVCRLGEGVDTALDPQRRKETLGIIRNSELRLHTCCEPIGPEHTPAELVEQLFLGVENGCYSHAAMRRNPVPGSPLAHRGQISELRLAQIVAVVALATLEVPGMAGIGVHEPNVLGLTSGATSLCAETGVNPRDTADDTAGHFGRSVEDCRQLLREAGFDSVVGVDGKSIPLPPAPPPAISARPDPVAWTIDAHAMAAAADRYFMADDLSCGEAVFRSACEAMGIQNGLVSDAALGMGGGVGLQGHVCGAVSGAALAISLALAQKTPDYGQRKMPTFVAAGRICRELETRLGSVECRTLCGLDLTTREGLGQLVDTVKAHTCAGYVREAARVLAEELTRIDTEQ